MAVGDTSEGRGREQLPLVPLGSYTLMCWMGSFSLVVEIRRVTGESKRRE